MTDLDRLIDRLGRDRVLYGGLAASFALLVKIVLFDPNLEFKPVCFNTSFSGGFETVRGTQTESFREAIRYNLARYGFRVSGEGRNYISVFTWLITDTEEFWRDTNGAVRTVIDQRGLDPSLSDREKESANRGHVRCKLVKIYAIEK